MKELWRGGSSNATGSAKKGKWKRLFKSRVGRKCSISSDLAEEYLDLESDFDKTSQTTNDLQNNVDYFDFTFVE
jgi:hypothetical protein